MSVRLSDTVYVLSTSLQGWNCKRQLIFFLSFCEVFELMIKFWQVCEIFVNWILTSYKQLQNFSCWVSYIKDKWLYLIRHLSKVICRIFICCQLFPRLNVNISSVPIALCFQSSKPLVKISESKSIRQTWVDNRRVLWII